MRYNEAFNYLLNNYGKDTLRSPFIVKSILLDLIGNDIYSKRLVDVYILLSKYTDIRMQYEQKGPKGAFKYLYIIYLLNSNKISESEFKAAIAPISSSYMIEDVETPLLRNKDSKVKAVIKRKAKSIVKQNNTKPKINPYNIVSPKQLIINAIHMPNRSDFLSMHSFTLYCKGCSVFIEFNTDNKFILKVGNKVIDPLLKPCSYVDDMLTLSILDEPNQRVRLNLPYMVYQDIIIKGVNIKVNVSNNTNLNNNFIDRVIIDTRDSDVYTDVLTDYLDITNTFGNVNVKNKISYINLNLINSDTSMEVINPDEEFKLQGTIKNSHLNCNLKEQVFKQELVYSTSGVDEVITDLVYKSVIYSINLKLDGAAIKIK